MSQQPAARCPRGQVCVHRREFEGTWNEPSAEVGQMFSQSEALAVVTIATRCSYRTSRTPLILSQPARKRSKGLTV